MTIEELKARPDFCGSLNESQQAWTVAFCSNGGEKIKATKTAYPKCTTDKSAASMADRNLRHGVISRIVNEFFGRATPLPSKEQAQQILWSRITKNPPHKFFLEYMRLYGDWGGFDVKPAPPPVAPDKPKSEMDLILEAERNQDVDEDSPVGATETESAE